MRADAGLVCVSFRARTPCAGTVLVYVLVIVPKLVPVSRFTAFAEEKPTSARSRVNDAWAFCQLSTTETDLSDVVDSQRSKVNVPATVEPSLSGPDQTSDTFV